MDDERTKRLLITLGVSIAIILLLKTLLLRTGNQVKALKDKKAVAEKSQGAPVQPQPVPVAAESQAAPAAPPPAPASGVN